MSVKSGIWVAAHLRRCQAMGLMAVLAQRGAEEAGAVYVRALLPGRMARLFGPAPGGAYGSNGARRFALPLGFEPVPEAEAEEYLTRQKKYDPDIWIIDVEDREGMALLDLSSIEKE